METPSLIMLIFVDWGGILHPTIHASQQLEFFSLKAKLLQR
jgi:hypothetical protein